MENLKIRKKSAMIALILILGLLISAVPVLVPSTKAATDTSWTLVFDGRSAKADPNLKEYVWQKNATMAPNGPYDKIGLRRIVLTGATPKGVLLILPPHYGSGEGLISNPANDTFTKNETFVEPIYWANRGFDVYAIDWRSHFVPYTQPDGSYTNASQLAFMANWGWDQWISDAKEAVEKVKEVSGATKIFLVGMDYGGETAVNYATVYQSDLRGLILLDARLYATAGSPLLVKRGGETNTVNLTQQINTMNAIGNWSTEYVAPSALVAFRKAVDNPSAPTNGSLYVPAINPATNKTWSNVTEYWTWFMQAYGLSNINGGYGNASVDLQMQSLNDRFFPARLKLESLAMADWVNCPYLSHDFDDNYDKISVPILAFVEGLYMNASGRFRFVNPAGTSDFTGIMLPKYGLVDTFYGTNSVIDISQPASDWMSSHYQPPSASAFCSVSVMTGQTWYFFAHSSGGIAPYFFQWYEGNTLLTGQTSMLLPITKSSPGTYTYSCRVTDTQGTIVTSNTVTLTVIGR